jgi:hypothetical protein
MMKPTIPFIPWPDAAQWSAANASLEHNLRRHSKALNAACDLARELRTHLNTLFPLMDHLCLSTCSSCNAICCQHACVWIDFKDLLFLHLADIPRPSAQLLGRRGERCRCSTPQGCQLDRIQRPFVCTWYLCPAQTGILRKIPLRMQMVTQTLQSIKQLRREMESEFIRVVA